MYTPLKLRRLEIYNKTSHYMTCVKMYDREGCNSNFSFNFNFAKYLEVSQSSYAVFNQKIVWNGYKGSKKTSPWNFR